MIGFPSKYQPNPRKQPNSMIRSPPIRFGQVKVDFKLPSAFSALDSGSCPADAFPMDLTDRQCLGLTQGAGSSGVRGAGVQGAGPGGWCLGGWFLGVKSENGVVSPEAHWGVYFDHGENWDARGFSNRGPSAPGKPE